MVDEKNKKVEFQVDPMLFNNASEEEQKRTIAKLNHLAAAYQRAGYAILETIKRIF